MTVGGSFGANNSSNVGENVGHPLGQVCIMWKSGTFFHGKVFLTFFHGEVFLSFGGNAFSRRKAPEAVVHFSVIMWQVSFLALFRFI